jgi:hypothetical protein
MCIGATDTCSGGASIGCLEGGACPAGSVCCASLLGGATACAPANVCGFAGGFVLCSAESQCPTATPRCCRLGPLGVCRASCP